ncbi:MAG TPA: TIGR00730 family Rossman fold protein [Tepidisphaeraceae bacterium]|jgi:hypothetical protein|nr:TIGR00730 family Rossman fold protein [Tepidisphaeraceae bacterium]
MNLRSVTVYCSSSSAIPKPYFDAGESLGRAIAENHWNLVYGGNSVGLMGHIADACRSAGGKVIGITPQLFADKGVSDQHCHELVVCNSMRERKGLMEDRGDAFIALPGGLGTFEEVFEIIVGKQLRYHLKPIVLFDVQGYFDPLLAMIDHGINQHFIKPSARDLFFVAKDVPQIVEHFRTYQPPAATDKWFSHTPPPSALE